MIERGARKFVFIGRSGLDKLPARSLVKDLEEAGAHVQVFRGDVGNFEDVKNAVALVQGKIGGVIQAAMGLDVSECARLGSGQKTNYFPGTYFYHHAECIMAL